MVRAGVAVLVVAGAVALTGCGRSAPDTGSAPAGVASVAAPGAVATAAGPAAAVHVSTKRYRIDITFPQLGTGQPALMRALHANAKQAREQFLAGLPDPEQYPEFADRQLQLKIDYSLTSRMPRFLSVREEGMADTGGAHPIPIEGSFVYDTRAGKVIGLDALFADPATARKHLADFARQQLERDLLAKVPGAGEASPKAQAEWKQNMRSMIASGTEPSAANFSEFTVLAGAGTKAAGIELIFSPYQVAPYVYGTQTVDVPVDTFADLLAPAYRDAFDLP